MLVNHTHERLAGLGLPGTAKAFDDQLRKPNAATLTFEVRLELMIDREVMERDNKRLVARRKFAALRKLQSSRISTCARRAASSAPPPPSSSTATGSRASRNCRPRPTGVGKSRIACARATRHAATTVPSSTIACRAVEALALARGDGRHARRLKALSRVEFYPR